VRGVLAARPGQRGAQRGAAREALLALELEAKGYDWVKDLVAPATKS